MRNGVPPGTVRRAVACGGHDRPWMKYMRGELTADEFVRAFARQCFDIVSPPPRFPPLNASLRPP